MMEQVYITNLEKMQEDAYERTYQISRIADWMEALVQELRVANDLRRERPDK